MEREEYIPQNDEEKTRPYVQVDIDEERHEPESPPLGHQNPKELTQAAQVLA